LCRQLKLSGKLSCTRSLGSLLLTELNKIPQRTSYDIIIPVPSTNKTLRQRGYNQALELSRYIARKSPLSIDRTSLKKIRHTPDQHEVNGSKRHENLLGAFQTKRSFHGETCLLVDDIYTSGATAEACALSLKKAGALHVDVLTVARA
jgi:ComF family protein